MLSFQILALGCCHNITNEQIEHFLHKITGIRFCRERTTLDIISEFALWEIRIHQMDQCLIHILGLFVEVLVGRKMIIAQSDQFGISLRIEHIPILFFQTFIERLIIFEITFTLCHHTGP